MSKLIKAEGVSKPERALALVQRAFILRRVTALEAYGHNRWNGAIRPLGLEAGANLAPELRALSDKDLEAALPHFAELNTRFWSELSMSARQLIEQAFVADFVLDPVEQAMLLKLQDKKPGFELLMNDVLYVDDKSVLKDAMRSQGILSSIRADTITDLSTRVDN